VDDLEFKREEIIRMAEMFEDAVLVQIFYFLRKEMEDCLEWFLINGRLK